MAKRVINKNPNDFEPIVVNGCLIEPNTVYEVVAKEPSDKSPEDYRKLGSVKERFPGVSNTVSLTQSDSGFFEGSPVFNTIEGLKNDWIKRPQVADEYFEIFCKATSNGNNGSRVLLNDIEEKVNEFLDTDFTVSQFEVLTKNWNTEAQLETITEFEIITRSFVRLDLTLN